MSYSLRTLLILLAVVPPMLAGAFLAYQHYRFWYTPSPYWTASCIAGESSGSLKD